MVVDLPEPQLVLKKMQGTATAPTSARTYGDVIRPYHDQHKLGQTARNSWHVHLQTLFVQHSQTKDQEKKKKKSPGLIGLPFLPRLFQLL